jgi:hypothetical protein
LENPAVIVGRLGRHDAGDASASAVEPVRQEIDGDEDRDGEHGGNHDGKAAGRTHALLR